MSDAPASSTLDDVIARANEVARFQHRDEVGADHLLLAVMAEPQGPWAGLLQRCGVGSYEEAETLAGKLPPRASLPSRRRAAAARPMRRVLIDWAITVWQLLLRFLRVPRRVPDSSAVQLAADAHLTIAVARRLAPARRATTGHLLVALASLPGRQVRLLRREHQLVAAAARREVGIARWRDRLLLALHRPGIGVRALQGSLRSGGGWRLLPWLLLRACGLFWAFLLFGIETLATAALYLFLWPALLLTNCIRALIAKLLRVDFVIRRPHDVIGGELDVTFAVPASDRRVAAAVLLPRLVCFVCAIVSLTVFWWPAQRLGVQPFPLAVARIDLIQGNIESAQFVTPMLLLFDALYSNGFVAGVGLLAGIGAGMLSLPSVRELQLIRLAGGHDVGHGSLLLRVLLAPLLLGVGVLAAVEAILPFRGGPLYLTVFVLPLVAAMFASAAIGSLALPY